MRGGSRGQGQKTGKRKEDRQELRKEQCMLKRVAERPGKARVAVLYNMIKCVCAPFCPE